MQFWNPDHSRIPVYEETVDNIIGILHAKDVNDRNAEKNDRRN